VNQAERRTMTVTVLLAALVVLVVTLVTSACGSGSPAATVSTYCAFASSNADTIQVANGAPAMNMNVVLSSDGSPVRVTSLKILLSSTTGPDRTITEHVGKVIGQHDVTVSFPAPVNKAGYLPGRCSVQSYTTGQRG
jgi:hypothetical protein